MFRLFVKSPLKREFSVSVLGPRCMGLTLKVILTFFVLVKSLEVSKDRDLARNVVKLI